MAVFIPDGLGMGAKNFSLLGEQHAVAASLDKLDAKFGLKRRDGLVQALLGDDELFRCCVKCWRFTEKIEWKRNGSFV